MDYLDNLFIDKIKQVEAQKYFIDIKNNKKSKQIYDLIVKYVNIKDIDEFILIGKEVLTSYEFQRRLDFPHHGKESVVEHSIKVASLAYKLSKYLEVNVSDLVLASLMHDMYSTPWQTEKNNDGLLHAHGFVHARIALNNCKEYYPSLMNNVIENSILRHMFPLNIRKPKYNEGWVLVFCDKYVSMSIFKDVKKLPSYVGIRKISKKKLNNGD